MNPSVFKKIAILFSIAALGFLFQNCSGGGGGTGGSSGPNSGGPSGPQPVECRDGFVGIPNDSDYDTGDFCVMKFEAKNDGSDNAVSVAAGDPWASINRADARAACEASDLQLLTNNHWQTIARNIESVKENWANNTIGDADGLNRGHSDGTPNSALAAGDDNDPCVGTSNDCSAWTDQKRTHTISNRGNR